MDPQPSLFSNMTPTDWLLAALFTAVVTVLVQLTFPPYGWLIGIVIAMGLLYLAKRRRDKLTPPPDEDDPRDLS